MIIIEKLKIEEIPQFHEIFSVVINEGFCYSLGVKNYFITRGFTQENFRYWLSNNYKQVLVAKEGQKIAGFLVYDAPYGGVLFCRWLGVVKEYRGKKIASRLFDEFIKIAQDLFCHKVEVAAQPPAREFYQKYGLKEEGFREKSYFGIDQYVFGKVIGEINNRMIQ